MKDLHSTTIVDLLNKLERFYKKFYLNRLIQGILISLGIVLSFFLFFDLIIFYGRLPTTFRFIIFYLLILIFLSAIYYGIINPLLRLFRIIKGLSEEEAAEYIGRYYPEISDKLLNTIQFNQSSSKSELMLASIQSRTELLAPFNFAQAAPPIEHKKSIFFLLVPLSFLIVLLTFNAKVVTEGTKQMINYHIDYSVVAPFKFEVIPGNTKVSYGADLKLRVSFTGEDIPNNVFINIDDISYRAKPDTNGFSFLLENITHSFSYKFTTGQFSSELYVIDVLPNPVVTNVNLVVEYPEYIGKERKLFTNPSLLEVPEGSRLFWEFVYSNSVSATLIINKKIQISSVENTGKLVLDERVYSDRNYVIELNNLLGDKLKGFESQLIVTKDEYPVIQVQSQVDSGNIEYVYFVGSISDDYGFSSLQARFNSSDSAWLVNIPINYSVQQDVFSFVVNTSELTGNTNILFEIRDNDRLNKFKLTKSRVFQITVLDDLQKDSVLAKEGDNLLEEMLKLSDQSINLDKSIIDVKMDLMNKNNIDWETQEKLKNIIKSGNELHNNIDKTLEKFIHHQQRYNIQNKEIIEKQKQLENLFNKLLDKEVKRMYEELQRLLEKLNKDEIQNHLQKMKMNQEDILDELDRNLEIFKQLELEQGIERALDKLDELARKQKNLAEDNLNKDISKEQNIEQQQELNKEFEKLREEMKRIDSLNNALEDPNKLSFEDKLQEDISKEQKKSIENSEKRNRKKSSENQKRASELMNQMREKIGKNLEMASSSQHSEDLEQMRKLLENLLELSFKQEELMMRLKKIKKSDPIVVKISQNQKRLEENSQGIKDSLYALSTRVPQLGDIVDFEVKNMTNQMVYSLNELEERRLSQAAMNQQKSLTSINNLANLIDEIIQQMEQQQSQGKPGQGSCTKPGAGNSKPGVKSTKQMQKELQKQMERLKKQLEKGNSAGNKKPGRVGEGLSKELARMAAQQEKIREEIRKISEELQKNGNFGGSGELKELEKLMEENEEDIINMNLDQEFFERQKQIEIKLLEAETSERERETDQKRESETTPQIQKTDSKNIEEYQKLKEAQLELLRLFNPALSGYYKQQVQKYNLEMR